MYQSGYRFRTSAKYESGKLVQLPIVHDKRFSDRSIDDLFTEIEDEEILEVIRYDDGAVYVNVVRTGRIGYLG